MCSFLSSRLCGSKSSLRLCPFAALRETSLRRRSAASPREIKKPPAKNQRLKECAKEKTLSLSEQENYFFSVVVGAKAALFNVCVASMLMYAFSILI